MKKKKKNLPFAMIVRNPLLLSFSEEGMINELLLDGDQSHMLEAKKVHSPKIVLQFHLFHEHHVLNADSKMPLLIIPRLIGHLFSPIPRD